MALSYPLSAEAFFALFPVKSASFDLPDVRAHSGVTGAGEILTSFDGVRLWQGEVTLNRMTHDRADMIKTMIEDMCEVNATFYLYDTKRTGPRADPGGELLGAATPQIGSVNGNNIDMTLKGLPAGYVLSVGDSLSFAYGSNPVRQALHRVRVAVPADGAGVAAISVSPRLRPGAAVNAQVRLIRPVIKALIVPGSYKGGVSEGVFTTGVSFAFRQVLR